MRLEVDIRGFWRAGTGASVYAVEDSLCARDAGGLPYLPGRHLKGLLRDAVRRAEALGWLAECGTAPLDGWENHLFGERGYRDATDGGQRVVRPYAETRPGILRVNSAHLPATDRAALATQADLVPLLFQTLRSTAMNEATGTARNRSLRQDEVAVPMRLEFEVTRRSDIEDAAQDADWETALAVALPLIRAVGQKRTRGLGRAVVRPCEVTA